MILMIYKELLKQILAERERAAEQITSMIGHRSGCNLKIGLLH